MTTAGICVFCEIIAGRAEASVIYNDERVLAFMDIHPVRPGQCMVIPKAHIDHFTDMDDSTSAHVMVTGQRIARRIREHFACERVGFVVHGYGVPHAHLVIAPQHHEDDITAQQCAYVDDKGGVSFSSSRLPLASREILDAHARLLAAP